MLHLQRKKDEEEQKEREKRGENAVVSFRTLIKVLVMLIAAIVHLSMGCCVVVQIVLQSRTRGRIGRQISERKRQERARVEKQAHMPRFLFQHKLPHISLTCTSIHTAIRFSGEDPVNGLQKSCYYFISMHCCHGYIKSCSLQLILRISLGC